MKLRAREEETARESAGLKVTGQKGTLALLWANKAVIRLWPLSSKPASHTLLWETGLDSANCTSMHFNLASGSLGSASSWPWRKAAGRTEEKGLAPFCWLPVPVRGSAIRLLHTGSQEQRLHSHHSLPNITASASSHPSLRAASAAPPLGGGSQPHGSLL